MELNKNSWYVRWFFWSLGLWDEFLDNDQTSRVEERGTNLCHFVRVMCIYAPFVLTIHAITYAGVIAIVTVLPAYLFGIGGYLGGLGVIATLGLLIWGAVVLHAWRREKADMRQVVRQPASASSGPSFRAVVAAHLAAQKSKVCPMITFAGQQDEVRP